MPANVQASMVTSGPVVRFAGDTIVSTLVVGNTGSGATATAVGSVVSVPVPTGATRTGWTREDRGTPGGTSAGTTSGVGAITQSVDWDTGEYAIYTVVDVLPGLAGSTYQLVATVTPPAGNLSAIAGLAAQLVTCSTAVQCFESGDGVLLRLTDASPRVLAGALVLDNETIEISNGVVRARISPHARGSTVPNPVGPDPDGTGLNSSEGLGASSLGIGLALAGSVLSWKGVTDPTVTVNTPVGQATAVRLTNPQTHAVIPFFGCLWSGTGYADSAGHFLAVIRLSHPGTASTPAAPATAASAVFTAQEIHGGGNAPLYAYLRLRSWELLGPVIPAGGYYEFSVYPQLVTGSSPTGTITATVLGLAVNP